MVGYRAANANEMLVVSGLSIKDEFLLTKRKFIYPLQRCYSFVITPFNYDLVIKAMSHEKLSFDIPASLTLGPNPDDEKELRKYVRLLVNPGTPEHQERVIRERVEGILEGEMRAVAASMTIEEIYNNRKEFQSRVSEYIATALSKFGLVLYNASIKELKDNGGFFTVQGQKASEAAAAMAKVSMAESKMLSDIGATDRNCKAQRETTRLKSETVCYENTAKQTVIASKAELEIKNAKYDAGVKIADIEGNMKANVREQELKLNLAEKQVAVEIQRLRGEQLSKAVIDAEKIMKLSEAKAYDLMRKADATLYEKQKEAEGKLYKMEKEAQGVRSLLLAQAEGINDLISSFDDEEAALQYIMLDKNVFKLIAMENTKAIQGLKPQFNIWETDGDEKPGLRGILKDLPPLLTAIADQTGIQPPQWLAQMPSDAAQSSGAPAM